MLLQASIFTDKGDPFEVRSTLSISGLKQLCTESCFPVTTYLQSQAKIKSFYPSARVDEGTGLCFRPSRLRR